MDPSKVPDFPAGRAKKSATTVPFGQLPRRNDTADDDVEMLEPTFKIPSLPHHPIASSERSSNVARPSGNTLPQTTKKTTAAKKVSAIHVAPTKSASIPRVRSVQHTSVARQPPQGAARPMQTHSSPSVAARKAGSSFLSRKQQVPAPQPTPFSTKTANPVLPLWQQLDEEYVRVHKRQLNVRRMIPQSRKMVQQNPDPIRSKASIAPNLELWSEGQKILWSSEDEDEMPPQRPLLREAIVKRAGGVRQQSVKQFAAKTSAARKNNSVDTSDSESPESGSATSDESEEDQLLPEEYELPLRSYTTFNPAPEITIELPQVKAEPVDDFLIEEKGPPKELLDAIEALTISPIRMQATRRLPFLRRNLRHGFTRRCADVLIPIHSDQKLASLLVVYEYVDGIVYQAELEEWRCPLCDLFGSFTTQATLFCHLKWDHREFFWDCGKIEESDDRQKWKLRLLIPQTLGDGPSRRDDQQENEYEQDDEHDDDKSEEEEQPETPEESNIPVSPSAPVPTFSSPFPSVSLSPPSPRKPETKIEITTPHIPTSLKTENFREASQLSQSSSIPQATSSRNSSTTGTSRYHSTATPASRIPPLDPRYPTPPPPDDPLGPSCRYPYLPAHSQYGGPTIHYSCRPGGACLFDLLGTLPMEEFGILEWQVIDREEEIYESDDVKDEYKVMHALWARWIMLHRNKFISNYLQGTIAFVDHYWRMIHRAAGWDALRYFLYILLANGFLSAPDMKQVLIHYEGLTGMAFWCNSS